MSAYKIIDKDIFEDLYFSQNLSLTSIAARIGISVPTVRSRFKSYGFVNRPVGSWAVKYQKHPFMGSDLEKSYLLGFRVGDLNVYSTSSRANVIIVRTNTTDNNQIKLMYYLFSKYGGIKVCGNNKARSVNCHLDKSFSFLFVRKPYEIEGWITNLSENSIAFMAGYIDAEGNFILNQGRARFTIDSYDVEILKWMNKWLIENNINSKLRLIAAKGSAKYIGGHWNNDLWRLNVNSADSLYIFCRMVLPYLHHEKRIKDVKLCLINILQRRLNGTIQSAINT